MTKHLVSRNEADLATFTDSLVDDTQHPAGLGENSVTLGVELGADLLHVTHVFPDLPNMGVVSLHPIYDYLRVLLDEFLANVFLSLLDTGV